MSYPELPQSIMKQLHGGGVIPAHPLALDGDGYMDEPYQKALSRYYLDAGSIGLAVGVHTTQFEIRDHGLYKPVLELAAEVMNEKARENNLVRIAGVSGPTKQAVGESEVARTLGYNMVLVSMGGLAQLTEEELVDRARKIAEVLPLFGFYLQPAVGGRHLSYNFWSKLVEIPNLYGVKVAPFDRYATHETIRAILESDRWEDIALYTGNDDSIVWDLLSTFQMQKGDRIRRKVIAGGLLGQWAVGTHRAVELMVEIKQVQQTNEIPAQLLQRAWQVTDTNGALFDVANGFEGCIAGIHQVLWEQGLLRTVRCLNPNESLSPGQAAEIRRVRQSYPFLHDDEFVAENLSNWLK